MKCFSVSKNQQALEEHKRIYSKSTRKYHEIILFIEVAKQEHGFSNTLSCCVLYSIYTHVHVVNHFKSITYSFQKLINPCKNSPVI